MDVHEEPVVIRVRQGAIDDRDFPLGIVRLSTDESVRFMNRAAREMIGDEVQVGDNVSDVDLDASSEENLRVALQERFQDERGSHYPLRIRRRNTGTQVRVQVSAVPEYDAEGKLIGSVGLIVDQSMDAARMAIHQAIQQAPDSAWLFAALCRELHEIVGFETMLVTGISGKRRHLQRLFEDPPPPEEVLPTKWWPMPPFIQAMFDEFKPGPLDLDELFARPDFVEYGRKDPTVRQFMERGFKHALRVGVYRAGQLVATVSLMKRRPVAYTKAELERCLRLPVVEAVNTAMALDQQRQLQFGLDLINDIAQVAESTGEVARRLVDRLRQHYFWEHVSLFRVDENDRRLRMICQAAEDPHRLPDDHAQSFSVGLIGMAYSTDKAVNAGNVLEEKWKGVYIPGIAGTRSELVLPVPGSKVRWLLNIESSFRDAFADEEQASVEVLLRVAGFILDRTAALELKSAVLKSVADAVIQTDSLGIIQDANPAAERLLGRPLAELQHRNLSNFITSSADERPTGGEETIAGGAWEMTQTAVPERQTGVMLVQAGNWPPTPVELVRPDGELVPVLMSSATLPPDHGGKVFVASDLTSQKRVEHLELIKQGLRHIASEVRIPLALAATFLGDACGKSDTLNDLIDKSLKQIRKADIPLERVVRLAAASDDKPLPQIKFDLRAAVTEMLDELPKQEFDAVRVLARDDVVLVTAARYELLFCMQSLLAHLLRTKSQVEKVVIMLGRTASKAFATLSLASEAADSTPSAVCIGDTLEEKISLATPVIEDLMRRMGGRFVAPGRETSRFRLVLALGDDSHDMAIDRS